jgi:hypothetical protein
MSQNIEITVFFQKYRDEQDGMSAAFVASRDWPLRSAASTQTQESHMTLVRSIFLALAVMLPTAWTVARAADAPAGEAAGDAKKEKKASKKKGKADGAEGEKKADDKAAK